MALIEPKLPAWKLRRLVVYEDGERFCSLSGGPNLPWQFYGPSLKRAHVAYADPEIRPALQELRAKLRGLDGGAGTISEKVTKHQRVAYSVAQIFAEVKVQKKRVLIRFFGTTCPTLEGSSPTYRLHMLAA